MTARSPYRQEVYPPVPTPGQYRSMLPGLMRVTLHAYWRASASACPTRWTDRRPPPAPAPPPGPGPLVAAGAGGRAGGPAAGPPRLAPPAAVEAHRAAVAPRPRV